MIRISKREKEILVLSANGLVSKEIAAELGISKRTVETHLTSIMKKFRTVNKTHSVAIAIRNNLI